jgi:hypothetical protein
MKCKLVAVLCALAGAFVLTASSYAIPTVYPTGVTINQPGVAEGYVIFPGGDGQVHLIGADGTELHTWTFPCDVSFLSRPLATGNILALACGDLMEMDWNGTVVWQVSPPAGATFHHDAERLPNGNTLILCQQTISVPSISDKPILEDFLIEVDSAGSIVWEWHEADHFTEFGFSQERLDKIYQLGGDWSHASGMATITADTTHTDARFVPGNIILTLRHQNTVAIIERATSQLVYVDTDFAIGPHATYMIPGDYPGGNNLLMFENSYAGEWDFVTRDHSRIWETDPVYNYRPFFYIDEYSGLRLGAFFSHIEGGAQRLSNGNTLITEADFGRIFEISPGMEIVWEYVSPYYDSGGINEIPRAYKVPLEWAGAFFAPLASRSTDAIPEAAGRIGR